MQYMYAGAIKIKESYRTKCLYVFNKVNNTGWCLREIYVKTQTFLHLQTTHLIVLFPFLRLDLPHVELELFAFEDVTISTPTLSRPGGDAR